MHQWQNTSTLSYKRTTPHNSSIRSDEGLTLSKSLRVVIQPLETHKYNDIFASRYLSTSVDKHWPGELGPR